MLENWRIMQYGVAILINFLNVMKYVCDGHENTSLISYLYSSGFKPLWTVVFESLQPMIPATIARYLNKVSNKRSNIYITKNHKNNT
jgi:hypothetical protein